MPTDMLRLTWADFDRAVAVLAALVNRTPTRRLYGIPRGGLCLAVALSHATGLPLSMEPGPDCAFIDDIADTGTTLREYHGPQKLVWALRPRALINVAYAIKLRPNDDRWVLFPWEKESEADKDRDRYAFRSR